MKGLKVLMNIAKTLWMIKLFLEWLFQLLQMVKKCGKKVENLVILINKAYSISATNKNLIRFDL